MPRPLSKPIQVFLRRPEWFLTILAFFVWLTVRNDYGATWDETPHVIYGRAVWTYFTTGQSLAEFKAGLIPKTEFYNPTLDTISAATAQWLTLDEFAAKHTVQGLLWVALFWPVCRLGARLGGAFGAWGAGLALLGMPSLYGHAFNNPKDLPLACAAAWLLHASTWAAHSRRIDWRHALGLGGALGFVLMMRPGAWFLGALWGLVALAHGWRTWRTSARAWGPMIKRLAGVYAGALVFAWLLMISIWPHAYESPFGIPIKAALFARHFDEVYPVLYRGVVFPSNALPADYLPGYLFLTLPLAIIAGAVAGHISLVKRARRSATTIPCLLGLGFLLWFPLCFFVVARPNIYDGMRHFLFMLPAVAVFTGAGSAWAIRSLSRIVPAPWAIAAACLALLSALPTAIRLHPYQVAYYNPLAGAREKIHERFETDYWISSFRETAEWINTLPPRADGQPRVILLSATGFSYNAFTNYLRIPARVVTAIGDYKTMDLGDDIDLYVGMVRYAQWRNFPSRPVIHRIERDGVLMCLVRGRTGDAEVPPAAQIR